jgi:hypothetical protein
MEAVLLTVLYHWPTVLVSLLAVFAASTVALIRCKRGGIGQDSGRRGRCSDGSGNRSNALHRHGRDAVAGNVPLFRESRSVVYRFGDLNFLAALWLTFGLRHEMGSSGWRKLAGAIVMGAAFFVFTRVRYKEVRVHSGHGISPSRLYTNISQLLAGLVTCKNWSGKEFSRCQVSSLSHQAVHHWPPETQAERSSCLTYRTYPAGKRHFVFERKLLGS